MRALRDEADVIVTNPPFSLFHDFMTWVFEARKLERDFGAVGRYPRYGNFDAIPCDCKGVMGVPISFLRRHDPEQFELLGMSGDLSWASSECGFFAPPPEEVQRLCHARNKTWRVQKVYVDDPDGLPLIPVYDRLFIRSRELGGEDR